MKPTYINGLLLGAFLLFAIVYWNIRSTSFSSETASSSQASANVSNPGTFPSTATASPGVTIDALKERVASSPDDTTLLNHLAQTLHDTNQYEEAATYYEKYLALAPTNIQGWLDLANVYAALEKWDDALDASQSLLEFAHHHPSAMYNMGAIHANLANIDEAIYWWTRVRDQQIDPELALQATQNLLKIQPSSSQ